MAYFEAWIKIKPRKNCTKIKPALIMVENGTQADLESHSTGSMVAAAVPAAVQPALHGRQTRQVFNGLMEQLSLPLFHCFSCVYKVSRQNRVLQVICTISLQHETNSALLTSYVLLRLSCKGHFANCSNSHFSKLSSMYITVYTFSPKHLMVSITCKIK